MTPRIFAGRLVRGLAYFGALSFGLSSADLVIIWGTLYAPVNDCASMGTSGACGVSAFLGSEASLLAIVVVSAAFAVVGLVLEHKRRRFAAILLILFVLGFSSAYLYSIVPTSSAPPTTP